MYSSCFVGRGDFLCCGEVRGVQLFSLRNSVHRFFPDCGNQLVYAGCLGDVLGGTSSA